MTFFGEQVIALLDHLEIDEAVVARHLAGRQHRARGGRRWRPSALRGMVIEMPVLDNALLALRARLHAADGRADLRRAGDARSSQAGAKRVPRLPWLLDFVRRHRAPGPGARRAPCSRACSSAASRRTAASAGRSRRPTLVIGHRRDPVHPFSDAGMLAEELPERPPARGELDRRAADRARAADRRDRRLHRRVLAAAAPPARRGAQGRARRTASLIGPCPAGRRKRSAAARSGRSASRRRPSAPRAASA